MTATDFEKFCAEILKQQGWEARTTKGSGDQGVDVLAQKGGVRIAIQCKFYTRPVGNKAVQEAFAAARFSGATIAAVVTNMKFTPSAQSLASCTGVQLLHVSELRKADDKFGTYPIKASYSSQRAERWCSKCSAILRLPFGNSGYVTCPRCTHRFYATT